MNPHICSREPQPRYARMLSALESRKKAAAASPLAAGGTAALISYLARMKALNDEIAHNNRLSAELGRREKLERQPAAQPGFASTRIDSFIAGAKKEMVKETQRELQRSDSLIADMESDFAACSYVRDGGIAAAALAAALLAAYSTLRIVRRKDKRRQEEQKAAEPHRERKVAQPMPDLAHARTELKPVEKPPYYCHYHSRLTRKLRHQMGENSAAVAEIALMAFPLAAIHMIIDDPSEIGPCIGMQRAYYELFTRELLKRGLRPDEIFLNMDLPPKKPSV
ncbi:MAG: hypothetical protein AB1657_06200 [Candidatus Micrarchaeota archaeon]